MVNALAERALLLRCLTAADSEQPPSVPAEIAAQVQEAERLARFIQEALPRLL
jgi:hypothetical protein